MHTPSRVRRAWNIAFLGTTMLASLAKGSAVEGSLTFPSAFVPALTVYARDLDTNKLHSVATRESQTVFKIELPPGRYIFFAEPSQAGAPDIYGAFTQSVLCKARNAGDACDDHSLVVYTIGGRTPAPAISDWTIPDDLAQEFDQLLGNREESSAQDLGAPHFSEYPASVPDPAPTAAGLDLSTSGLAPDRQERVLERAKDGANFAGSLVIAEVPCGQACVDLVLVDLSTGKSQLPPPVAQIAQDLPCRTDEAIRYRRNSRLLSITRKRDAAIVTQYFVWKPGNASLSQIAEFQRGADRFCSPPARDSTGN